MSRKQVPTNIFGLSSLKNFLFDENDDELILRPDNTVDPILISVLKLIFDFNFKIEYHRYDTICPVCGSKLNRNGNNNLYINKVLPVFKKDMNVVILNV